MCLALTALSGNGLEMVGKLIGKLIGKIELVGKAMRLWMNGLGTTDITDLIRDLWNIDSLLTRTQSSIMSYTFQSSFQGLSTSQDIRVHWSGPQDLLVQWSLMTHSGSDLWTRTKCMVCKTRAESVIWKLHESIESVICKTWAKSLICKAWTESLICKTRAKSLICKTRAESLTCKTRVVS